LHRPHDDGRTLIDADFVAPEDGKGIAARAGRHGGNQLIVGCVYRTGRTSSVLEVP